VAFLNSQGVDGFINFGRGAAQIYVSRGAAPAYSPWRKPGVMESEPTKAAERRQQLCECDFAVAAPRLTGNHLISSFKIVQRFKWC
jgi:hypothetical protein